ncbi:MAG: outer membrane lipid asymmetry maintenance protein MlaD [Oceanicaulis sp.]
MRGGAVLETVLGVLVLIAAGVFTVYAQGRLTEGPGRDGYTVVARFDSVGDLTRGAEVRVSGVPVGAVESISLDSETFFARAELNIRGDVQIPEDSTARIAMAGLLGGAYVAIEPGGAMETLEPGGEIEFTQGAVDMFDLIGEAVMNRGGSN